MEHNLPKLAETQACDIFTVVCQGEVLDVGTAWLFYWFFGKGTIRGLLLRVHLQAHVWHAKRNMLRSVSCVVVGLLRFHHQRATDQVTRDLRLELLPNTCR